MLIILLLSIFCPITLNNLLKLKKIGSSLESFKLNSCISDEISPDAYSFINKAALLRANKQLLGSIPLSNLYEDSV